MPVDEDRHGETDPTAEDERVPSINLFSLEHRHTRPQPTLKPHLCQETKPHHHTAQQQARLVTFSEQNKWKTSHPQARTITDRPGFFLMIRRNP